MKKIEIFLLTLIIVIAGFVRFWNLSTAPPSLNWDEVSHGYNAYSLLKTGKDQWGSPWPVFNFRAYGDYPMSLNLYLTIPSVGLFGLTEFSVRFPSASLGLLTVIFGFLFGKFLFKKNSYGLLLSFLMAVSPWMILPSRAVFQSTIAQLFLFSGVTFLFAAVKSEDHRYLALSLALMGISQYGYHSSRIVVPLLSMAAFIIFRTELTSIFRTKKAIHVTAAVFFLLLTGAQLFNLTSPDSRARGKWVFLIDEGAINQINESRRIYKGSLLEAKLVHNKVTYFVPNFLENVARYFDYKNLFINGGTQYQFSVQGHGVLYAGWLPFFYLGLLSLILGAFRKNKDFQFLLVWWFIGLIPAAITKDGFQAIRSFSIIPLPQVSILIGLATFGKIFSYDKKHGQIFLRSAFLIFIAFSLIYTFFYMKLLFGTYTKYYSWAWQYGYKEAIDYAKTHYDQYEKIIVTKKYGEPHEFILFYWPWAPKEYQNDPRKKWDYHANWYWVDSFDKFEFWNDWETKDKLKIQNSKFKIDGQKEKVLLITSPGNYIEGGQLLETVNFLDGTKAFDIVEY